MTALDPLAARLRAADPELWRAVMIAPPEKQQALAALHLWVREVAQIPWSIHEPTLAAMRLQWHRDRLSELAAGEPAPRHELFAPLAPSLKAGHAPLGLLHHHLDARERDLDPTPPKDLTELRLYLEDAGGAPFRAAARMLVPDLTPEVEAAAGEAGFAKGAARWIAAIPERAARGRVSAPNAGEAAQILRGQSTPELGMAIRALAEEALGRLEAARKVKIGAALPAFLPAVTAEAALRAAAKPGFDVFRDGLEPSEFHGRLLNLKAALFGRW